MNRIADYRLALALLGIAMIVFAILCSCGDSSEGDESGDGSNALKSSWQTTDILFSGSAACDTAGCTATPTTPSDIHQRVDARVRVRRGDGLVLATAGLTLTAADSAVVRGGEYSVTRLYAGELPPMPDGMVNVTAAGGNKPIGRDADSTSCLEGCPAKGQCSFNAAVRDKDDLPGGFRLLPSGSHFSPAAELRVAYDPGLLPMGYTPEDIHTSF